MLKDRNSLKKFFEESLNHRFNISLNEDQNLEVELIEIKDGKQIDELKITSFSLLFRSDITNYTVSQKLYQISKGEDFEEVLFIIPKQPDNQHSYFEVIFN